MDNQNLTPPPYREDVVSQAPEVIVETADVAKLFTKVFYWMAGALGTLNTEMNRSHGFPRL